MKTSPIQVTLQNHYGDDLMVANAARVSFSKHHDDFEEGKDDKLIGYLARENHFMPFCHPHVTFHVKAPIFVARQMVKHQIGGSWSEESRRYIDSEPEFYFPEVWHQRPDGSIKQGAGEVFVGQGWANSKASAASIQALVAYNHLLEEGIAPEEARMVLPLNTMTEWIWTGSLMFWARVCKLRLDSHAQGATSEVARQITAAIAPLYPVSWKALTQ